MEYRTHKPQDTPAVEELFRSVFTAAEGEQEGARIHHLVQEMLAKTASEDLFAFVAVDGADMRGAILFSRLKFETEVCAFILAPVAVHTDHQGQGIGQALITHGLQEIAKQAVEFVITYGDPAFYSKVGFHPISPRAIAAPFTLSQPVGWLGQSLTNNPIAAIPGRCVCVPALNDPAYW